MSCLNYKALHCTSPFVMLSSSTWLLLFLPAIVAVIAAVVIVAGLSPNEECILRMRVQSFSISSSSSPWSWIIISSKLFPELCNDDDLDKEGDDCEALSVALFVAATKTPAWGTMIESWLKRTLLLWLLLLPTLKTLHNDLIAAHCNGENVRDIGAKNNLYARKLSHDRFRPPFSIFVCVWWEFAPLSITWEIEFLPCSSHEPVTRMSK